MVRKAIIICPATLVKNWAAELDKWLQGKCKSTPVSDGGTVIPLYEGFKWNPISKVLITSYETLWRHVDKLKGSPIDLVICDEAHRMRLFPIQIESHFILLYFNRFEERQDEDIRRNFIASHNTTSFVVWHAHSGIWGNYANVSNLFLYVLVLSVVALDFFSYKKFLSFVRNFTHRDWLIRF